MQRFFIRILIKVLALLPFIPKCATVFRWNVEDTGEYLYSIDRMFWNLKRTGKLDKLKGLIIGGIKNKPDDPGEEFGRTVYEIVTEIVQDFSYPVCFDFPVGHQKNNYALKCGVRHRLSVNSDEVKLTEVSKV